MTQEQRDSLDRVKATFTYATDKDYIVESYSTKDVAVLIELVEILQNKVRVVEEDLLDLKDHLEMVPVNKVAIEFVDSTLMFLNEEE